MSALELRILLSTLLQVLLVYWRQWFFLALMWWTWSNLGILATLAAVAGALVWYIKVPVPLVTDISRKAVLITGCDTGFGHGAAIRLARRGMTVFATCLFPDGEGARALKQIDNIVVLQLDVTSDQHVQKCVAEMTSELSRRGLQGLWAVVNNAGICTDVSPMEWLPLSYFERCYQVNAMGVVRVTRAVLPLLRAARGRVVTVVSTAGRLSSAHFGAYAMSKHAALAFCDALRREISESQGVSVSTIEPNFYRTPLVDGKGYLDRANHNYSSLTPDQKDVYANVHRSMPNLSRFLVETSRPFVEEVPAVIERAVLETTPRHCYSPCFDHYVLRLQMLFAPYPIADAISNMFFAKEGYNFKG